MRDGLIEAGAEPLRAAFRHLAARIVNLDHNESATVLTSNGLESEHLDLSCGILVGCFVVVIVLDQVDYIQYC